MCTKEEMIKRRGDSEWLERKLRGFVVMIWKEKAFVNVTRELGFFCMWSEEVPELISLGADFFSCRINFVNIGSVHRCDAKV